MLNEFQRKACDVLVGERSEHRQPSLHCLHVMGLLEQHELSVVEDPSSSAGV